MTTNIEKIAVFANPNGENEFVSEFFRDVAPKLDAKISLLSLSESLPAYAKFPDADRKQRLEEILKHAASATVDELSGVAKECGVDIAETAVLTGRFPSAVEQWVENHSVDLLVKQTIATDGNFGFASKGDMRLTRHTKSPILLLHSSFSLGRSIVVGVPPTHGDAEGLSMAKRVITNGVSWAKTLGLRVHFVHAWELFGESLLKSRAPTDELVANLKAAKQHAQDDLQAALKASNVPADLDYETHVHKGDPTRVLMAEIELFNPALVVMGSVANDGVKGYLLGNTAETIARRKHNNVLVVR